MSEQKYWKTDKGKKANEKAVKKYRQSEKYKKTSKEYRQSDRGKELSKKCRQTDKGKATHNKAVNKYRLTDKGIIEVSNYSFIKCRIRSGELIKTNICVDCGKGNTEIHHEKYHDPPQLIDIAEVCKDCHIKRHLKGEGIIIE